MTYKLEEKLSVSSARTGQIIEANSLAQAKEIATCRQSFESTILILKTVEGRELAIKKDGTWINLFE